jgi:hypothetical protein
MGGTFIPIAWNPKPMLTTAPDPSAQLAANLLTHYSFDLGGYNVRELINRWQREYPINWLPLAVVEALYQGRYKAISVQQILTFWLRRGQTSYHFNLEFERMICGKLPERLTDAPSAAQLTSARAISQQASHAQISLAPVPSHSHQHYSQQEEKEAAREERQALPSLSFKINTHPGRTKAGAEVTNPAPQNYAARSIPAPPKPLPPAHNPPIGQFTPQGRDRTESLTSRLKMLMPATQPALEPPTANNSPINQFTPQTSDRSESFTSKLKAITGIKREPVYAAMD